MSISLAAMDEVRTSTNTEADRANSAFKFGFPAILTHHTTAESCVQLDRSTSDKTLATLIYDKEFLLQFQHLFPPQDIRQHIHHFVLYENTVNYKPPAQKPSRLSKLAAGTTVVPHTTNGVIGRTTARWMPKNAPIERPTTTPQTNPITEQTTTPPKRPAPTQSRSPIFNITVEQNANTSSDLHAERKPTTRPDSSNTRRATEQAKNASQPGARPTKPTPNATRATTTASTLRTNAGTDNKQVRNPLADLATSTKQTSAPSPSLNVMQPSTNPWFAKCNYQSNQTQAPSVGGPKTLLDKENRTSAKPVQPTKAVKQVQPTSVSSETTEQIPNPNVRSAPIPIKKSEIAKAIKKENDGEDDWDNPEIVARRLRSREKQIQYGYNTIGYKRYIESVPKDKRKPGMPNTPDKYQRCSKRSWDGQVRKWRRELHEWDPEEVKKAWEEKQASAALAAASVGSALQLNGPLPIIHEDNVKRTLVF